MKKIEDINELIKEKLHHDVGELIYVFLNNLEASIQNSLNAEALIDLFSLKGNKQKKRCVCPFHKGADNPSSLAFNDEKKCFKCHACGASGTYLDFIAKMKNYQSNSISEAKILAANEIAGIKLGFNSIADFEDKLTVKIIERYNITHSLLLKDYYDISLIDMGCKPSSSVVPNNTQIVKASYDKKSDSSKNDNIALNQEPQSLLTRKLDASSVLAEGAYDYNQAVLSAKFSVLISELTKISGINCKEALYNFAFEKYGITEDQADSFGLLYLDNDVNNLLSQRDFWYLNNRVLFPFIDHESGVIVGYQARTTLLNSQNVAKYLNVTDYGDIEKVNGKEKIGMRAFNVGYFLFNMYNIKNSAVKELFITEGAADTIKLSSLGYNSISPGQSNLTDYQISLIGKYIGKDTCIYLFFDNDKNNVGQNNSIKAAYKLYQYGFEDVHIVRTFGELGTDITDVATAIQDDEKLKLLIDIWSSNSYKFVPASETDIQKIYASNLLSETEIKQIDPREISEIAGKIEIVQEILKLYNFDSGSVKGLLNCDVDILKHLIDKSKSIDMISNPFGKPVCTHSASSKGMLPTENREYELKNLSKKQKYILSKKFDDDAIEAIDQNCNKKQIGLIIGMIVKGRQVKLEDFGITEYRNKGQEEDPFIPADDDPDLPF